MRRVQHSTVHCSMCRVFRSSVQYLCSMYRESVHPESSGMHPLAGSRTLSPIAAALLGLLATADSAPCIVVHRSTRRADTLLRTACYTPSAHFPRPICQGCIVCICAHIMYARSVMHMQHIVRSAVCQQNCNEHTTQHNHRTKINS